MELNLQEENKIYLTSLKNEFFKIYEIAKIARLKNYDPYREPESRVATDLAERVEKSVGPPRVSERIRILTEKIPREEIAFKISEEIVYGKYGHEGEEAADQAIRTGLSILDEGVTVAPIQGIVKSTIKTNSDRSRYLAVYFAGPIRSAGGTEMAMILILADFVRQLMGLSKYKATPEEAKRFVEELRLYEREVARFQYRFSDKELQNVILNLPVEATGIETDRVEVTTYRNIPRIETNCVRGGALRVVNDGLIGRSNKVIKIIEKLGISGWDWLKNIKSQTSEEKDTRQSMFMEEVIAGRPIFSFPSTEGGFRLRYGRARNTGLASIGLHPATMEILHNFIANGTQLKLEKPEKGGIVSSVETIEPPIVKLKDDSVVKVKSLNHAKQVRNSVKKILFLGDILIGFGEFYENNKSLAPTGYTEEWWVEHLKFGLFKFSNDLEEVEKSTRIDAKKLNSFITNPLITKPSITEAIKLSSILDIPLHPSYTYFWGNLNYDELIELRDCLRKARLTLSDNILNSMKITFDVKLKEILDRICIPHRILKSEIIIENEDAVIVWECLKPSKTFSQFNSADIFDLFKEISGITIYPKGCTYIGARMGRPEKAKKREMKPLVHSLFPIGLSGGSKRNIVDAINSKNLIIVEIANRKCAYCKKDLLANYCPDCNRPSVLVKACPICQTEISQDTCPQCNVNAVKYRKRVINLSDAFQRGLKELGLNAPDLIKGVKGLSNENKIPEPIEKGILRATYSLSVFKDGTIRFDTTNGVLTHFKPIEIEVTTEKIKELGYKYDWNNSIINDQEQVIPLKIQDIIIPKTCGDYLVKVSQFLDDLLGKFYKIPSFYHVKKRNDLIGHLVVGLSPHTSVGVIGRILGFTDNNVCYAHPFWHAAKRRDCDGDEDSVSLLLDVLVNFSKSFLPGKIGGMMDAPLLITLFIKPTEIARQAFHIETIQNFPLQFFEETKLKSDPKKISNLIEMVFHRLNTSLQFEQINFTHLINNINEGNRDSSYKKFTSMLEKVAEQLDLAEIIKAVNPNIVAQKVVSTHFMRDLVGNLKAYSSQKIRCKKCNVKYRRIPLSGKCSKCGGELSLTVFRGTIEKYLDVAQRLIEKYNLGLYYQQRISLIESEINRLFKENNNIEQKALAEFM